ncbi:MAG: Flp family type IVb pilin [Dehalococcoidia bacterium]
MEVRKAMVKKISGFFTGLVARLRSEAGQALAEYGLILALIAVVCILGLTALGLAVSGQLDAITAVMP